MPSDLATRSRNLGLTWTPEDNTEFNNLLGATDTREMFVKNLNFLAQMKGFKTCEDLARSIRLSEVYMERGQKGVMPYHVACYVASACGTNVERMFLEDLSEDPFLKKQAEIRKRA